MDQKYDFHAWFKVMTINIKNNFSFEFKITKCLGQFWCENDFCPLFVCSINSMHNEITWNANSTKTWRTIITILDCCCIHCLLPLHYTSILRVGLLDIDVLCCHKLQSLTWTSIHFGMHIHLVAHGKCWKITCQIKDMVRKEVNQTPNTNAFVITLASNKTFLFKHLLNDDNEGHIELLKGKRLHKGMENFFTLCSPNVWNLIASLKHYPAKQGYINNILALKTISFYYHCWGGY